MQETRHAQVVDIMTTPVEHVGMDASGEDAARVMARKHINHVVVTDADGVVAGVVSDRDLRNAQPSTLLLRDSEMRNKALSLIKVVDIMTSAPRVVAATLPARDALHTMLTHKVGSLPVVDEKGRPIGIITGFDVLQLCLGLLDQAPA